MPKILQISDLILKIMIWMIWILAASVTLVPYPSIISLLPWEAVSWPLMMPEIHQARSLRSAFVLAVPQKWKGFFILFRSAQMPPTHEGFLGHSIYRSPQNSLSSHPAFFFRTLARKVIIYSFKCPPVSVSSFGMTAHQGSCKTVTWHYHQFLI